jgi:hypothetical protein
MRHGICTNLASIMLGCLVVLIQSSYCHRPINGGDQCGEWTIGSIHAAIRQIMGSGNFRFCSKKMAALVR